MCRHQRCQPCRPVHAAPAINSKPTACPARTCAAALPRSHCRICAAPSAIAKVRLTARGMKLLKQTSPAIQQAITQTATSDPQHDGWYTADIPIESINHATNQLLALGLDVEVLAPGELRKSLADLVRAMGAMYWELPT
jgi:hypothetical protein